MGWADGVGWCDGLGWGDEMGVVRRLCGHAGVVWGKWLQFAFKNEIMTLYLWLVPNALTLLLT